MLFLWGRFSTMKFWGTLDRPHVRRQKHPNLWKFWLLLPQGLLDGLTEWPALPFTARESQIHNSQKATDRTASDHMRTQHVLYHQDNEDPFTHQRNCFGNQSNSLAKFPNTFPARYPAQPSPPVSIADISQIETRDEASWERQGGPPGKMGENIGKPKWMVSKR